MSLDARLKAEISREGPITVSAFMTACLHDPLDGYYATRPRLGAGGDFITAPMVSQMFGELLGLWAAQVWADLGRPARVRLVEVGPGDGSLMIDALRALRRVPAFLQAAEVWLVEPSAPLQALQRLSLVGDPGPHWVAGLAEVPGGAPMVLVANEVLDCLPARQFVSTGRGWAERRVGLDQAGELAFGLSPPPSGLDLPSGVPEGAVLEWSDAQAALGGEIGQRLARDGGAALLIDYGRDRFGFGDTLQALCGHRRVSPLETPGASDLTVHANFPAVVAAATAAGAWASAILGQGDFLRRLGIEARAGRLAAARPDRADSLGRQLARLVDPDQMGELFKVLALSQPGLAVAGFEP